MKVSIIVPVYNAEAYLRDCLDSLVNQTLKDIEIILIDDASTDKSFDIIMEYKRKYPSIIKVFKNEYNKGQGASRNIGLSLATGMYVGFVDSDDYVSKTMYEELYKSAISNNFPEVLSTGLTFVKDNSNLHKSYPENLYPTKYNPLEKPEFVLDESPSACNKIFLRKFISSKFLENRMWEDVGFTFSALFNANNVIHLNNMGYYYRKSATTGVSARGFSLNPHLLDIYKVADQISEETKKTNRYEILKPSITFKQVSTILQRAAEVLTWQIKEESKERIIYNMHCIILEKYGNWYNMDNDLLSGVVGIMELNKIKAIIKKYNRISSSPALEVASELETLRGQR